MSVSYPDDAPSHLDALGPFNDAYSDVYSFPDVQLSMFTDQWYLDTSNDPAVFQEASMGLQQLGFPQMALPRDSPLATMTETPSEGLSLSSPDDGLFPHKDMGQDDRVEAGHDDALPAADVERHRSNTPTEVTLTRPAQLVNLPTALCEHFFKEVITLYCAWDGRSNHMRVLTETMWQSSGALYHTMQSMAAACLAADFPDLKAVASKERYQALQCLQQQSLAPKTLDTIMASILLGHTESWINPNNLATDNYNATVAILDAWADAEGDHLQLRFFDQALDYWAMLLGFLTDSKLNRSSLRATATHAGPADPNEQVMPHPFSGISREIVQVLTDVGLLVSRYQKRISNVKFLKERDLDFFRDSIRKARAIERRLLLHESPAPIEILDPRDPKTPIAHLILVNEAYRCMALLQIYRVFPDLLDERYRPWASDELLRPRPAATQDTPPTCEQRDSWLTSLAIHTVGILRQIPFESSTRCLQPLILVAVSSELRHGSGDIGSWTVSTATGSCDSAQASIEVAQARSFLRSRLSAYKYVLPLKKISMISELVENIFRALDCGEKNVYWLNVCRRMRMETLMG